MIEDFYDSSALVESLNVTKTQMGSTAKSYASRIAALECRVDDGKNITELDQYGKMTVRTVCRLYCEASSTNRAIEYSDRVTVNSKVYQVETIKNPALQNHHLEIDMIEVI